MQAAAQFAQSKAQRQPSTVLRDGRDRRNAHVGLLWRGHAVDAPERIRTTRPQRAASAKSCVTRTSVVLRTAWPRIQQINDLLPRVLVEVSGWFVGNHDRWIGSQRTRNRDTLLLTPRKLGRVMVKPLA